jgi:chromosome segregation ATPase
MMNGVIENMDASLQETVDRLFTMVQSIDSRLIELDTKVDRRLQDTRPNWEGVQSQLKDVVDSQRRLRTELDGLQNSLGELRQDVTSIKNSQEKLREQINEIQNQLQALRSETEKGFRTIDRRMERQIGEFERLHAYQRDLEDRVDEIEKRVKS